MIILGLNTLGIVIETGLGIWIFSKAFPRREQVGCGWKHRAISHVQNMILHAHDMPNVYDVSFFNIKKLW